MGRTVLKGEIRENTGPSQVRPIWRRLRVSYTLPDSPLHRSPTTGLSFIIHSSKLKRCSSSSSSSSSVAATAVHNQRLFILSSPRSTHRNRVCAVVVGLGQIKKTAAMMMIVGPGFPPLWSWNSYKEPWEQISFKVSATHSASPFRDALFSELFMDEWIGLREGPV